MEIVIIAAVAENGVIGHEGKIPWHIPADLKRFRELTTGHAVVMGRKTFESIGKPLPNRMNIVISSSWYGAHPRDLYRGFGAPGNAIDCITPTVGGAIAAAQWNKHTKLFVCGGARVYEAFLPFAHAMELTFVPKLPIGDSHFPYFVGGRDGWLRAAPRPWRALEASVKSIDMPEAPFHALTVRFERIGEPAL